MVQSVIEQLWYTWSTTGLGSVTGLRVRAASPGLSDIRSERFRALEPYLYYHLPTNTDNYTANRANSPCSLLLVNTGNERILAQKVYVGKDAYGRPGVYFIHLLAGLPNSFLARDAIELWDSSFWQYSEHQDPANSVELPPIALSDLIAGSLNEHTLISLREHLTFVIQAYLLLKPYQRLYIAAPAEQVAILIWGLSHSIPRSLQLQLTFSTYEHNVQQAEACVIGTCWLAAAGQDLPPECYIEQGLALNTYSGKCSSLADDPDIASYARFAAACLIEGDKLRLDQFLHIADEMYIRDIASLLVLYEFFTAHSLSLPQITTLLKTPALAAGLLTQKEIQDSIIKLVIENAHWWNEHGENAFKLLRAEKENELGPRMTRGLASFATRVATEACTALIHTDTVTGTACLTILYAAARPATALDPWLHLLHCFAQYIHKSTFHPRQLNRDDVQLWLLQRWGKIPQEMIDDEQIRPWLECSWSELEKLLSLQLPLRWQMLAIKQLVEAPGLHIPPVAVALITRYPAVFDNVFDSLMDDEQSYPIVRHLFDALVNYGYPEKLRILSLLITAASQNQANIDDLLTVARLTDEEKLDIFMLHGSQLIACETLSPLVLSFVFLYLDKFSTNMLLQAANVEILEVLEFHITQLPNSYVQRLHDLIVTAHSVEQVGTDRYLPYDVQYLQELAKALERLKLLADKQYVQQFLTLVCKRTQTKEDLYAVVENFGSRLAGSPPSLLYHLAEYRGRDYFPGTSVRLLIPYITLTIEYAQQMEPSQKEQLLKKVFKVLLKNADRSVFDAITQQSLNWPAADCKDWQTYSAELRPGALGTLIKQLRGRLNR